MGEVVEFRKRKREYNLYELVAMAIKHDVSVSERYTDLDIIRVQYITALSRAGVLK